jgi:hypothetical protein
LPNSLLIMEMISDLVTKTSLALVLTIKSKYLFLYLVSWHVRTSVCPFLASGRTWRQGASKIISLAYKENSPVLDLPKFPTTPMISPLLMISLTSLNFCSDSKLLLTQMTYNFMLSDFISMKIRPLPYFLIE